MKAAAAINGGSFMRYISTRDAAASILALLEGLLHGMTSREASDLVEFPGSST